MKIVKKDLKKGKIVLSPTTADDLWLISQVISQGALLKGKTTRKIKISETKVEKKTYIMTIAVEKAEFEHDALRISGTVESEHDDIAKGSHHSILVSLHDTITIEQSWLGFQIQKIEDATKEKNNILLTVLDREQVYFAKLQQEGYSILSSLEGDVDKKVEGLNPKGNFYKEVERILVEYDKRHNLDTIVLASPAFFKDDFMKQLQNEDLRKKILLATCSSVTEQAFEELLKRDEVKSALAHERLREELEVVEELLSEIGKEGKATYGPNHVKESIDSGSVSVLLISSHLIDKAREEERFNEFSSMMKLVEDLKGKIHIINSTNEAGKKLDGIGGIAALLRY